MCRLSSTLILRLSKIEINRDIRKDFHWKKIDHTLLEIAIHTVYIKNLNPLSRLKSN